MAQDFEDELKDATQEHQNAIWGASGSAPDASGSASKWDAPRSNAAPSPRQQFGVDFRGQNPTKISKKNSQILYQILKMIFHRF